MPIYRIEGIPDEECKAITARSEGLPDLRIAFSAQDDSAALFEGDRRVLWIESGWWDWALVQDGVIRARLSVSLFGQDLRWWLHSSRVWLGTPSLPGRLLSPGSGRVSHAYNFRTIGGQGQIRQMEGGWDVRFIAPGGADLGKLERSPDGYALTTAPGADTFLVWGLALFVLARTRAGLRQASQTVIYRGPGYIRIGGGSRRRRRRDERRRWIDDPLTSFRGQSEPDQAGIETR